MALSTSKLIAQLFPSDLLGVSFPTTATIQRFVAHNNTFFALTVAGAYQTNNGGQNWREVTINGQQLQALNSYNNLLYARVDSSSYFVSSDNAITWSPSTIKMAEYFVVSSTAIFKIANVGVQRSTDAGISWETMPIGKALDLAVFREKIYSTTPGASFVSADNGNSWRTISVQRHPASWINPVSLTSFAGIRNTILVASSFGFAHVLGTYCGLSRSPALYSLKDTTWDIASYQTQLDKVYSFGTILLGLSKAECNDGWTNGGLFTSRNGIDWQPIVQRTIGTYKEWCSSCFDPYVAGFDNNGIAYIAASQISYSGPPAFRTERQPILLRSLSSITTDVVESNETQSINIAPNPASTYVSIQGQANFTGTVKVRFLNSIGNIALTTTIAVREGLTYYQNVNIQNLPTGIYFIELHENNRKSVKKLLKQ